MLPEHEVRILVARSERNEERICFLEERLNAMSQQVDKLTSDVNTLINTVTDGLATIQTEFNAFKAQVTADPTDAAALQALDDKVNAAITSIQGTIATVTAQ